MGASTTTRNLKLAELCHYKNPRLLLIAKSCMRKEDRRLKERLILKLKRKGTHIGSQQCLIVASDLIKIHIPRSRPVCRKRH